MWLIGYIQLFVFLILIFSCEYLRCANATNNSQLANQKNKKFTYEASAKKDGKNDAITITRPPPPPKNKCNSKICPEGLTHYRSLYKDFCYILLESQSFPPKCPYPLFLSVTDSQVEDIYRRFKDNTIWLMATRKTGYEFGPFEWISKDYNYGFPICHYTKTSYNISEKNCLVILNYLFIPVRCKEKHRALCIYPYDSASISKYCDKHYLHNSNYLTCVADGINIENQNCYCEMAHGGLRDSFCDTLAEPLLRHQSDLLIHKFQTVHDVCWIGLYTTESGIPRWTNSNATVNYSCWSSDVNHSKSLGAIKFIRDGGWMLADDDGTIQCAICELKNAYDKNVSLHLNYNPKSNSVELKVENPFEISDYFGGHYALFCFAGPTLEHFKQKISEPFYDFDSNPQSSPSVWVRHFTNEWDFPVYFWCEGFQHPNLKPLYSNKVLVCNTMGGYEYSLRVQVCTTHNMDPYLNETHLVVRNYILQKVALPYRHELRAMQILNYNQKYSQMEIVFHLSTEWNQDEQLEYKYLQALLREIFMEDLLILNIDYFRRSDVCLPSTTESNNKILHWPKTIIGAVTLPVEICLQKNGNPVMRKCEGNFIHGGFWSKVIGKCGDQQLSEKSKELNELLNNESITTQELGVNLRLITSDSQDIAVVDIYLISEILKKMERSGDDMNVTDVVTIFSNIMNFEPNELKNAQEMLNCTDNMLYSLDNILGKIKIHESERYEVFTSTRVLVQATDVRWSNITGLALKGRSSDDFESFTLIPLYRNISIAEILLNDTIELAAFLPDKLIQEIENCIPSEFPIKLLMALFSNDVLFNENVKATRQANSRILNILIPELYCSFTTPITIVFKPLYITGFEKKCAFWNYGQDGIMGKNIQGWWLEDGNPNIENNTNNTYAICLFDHVTHFALLMMGSLSKDVVSETHGLILDIITAVGTILSLLSILAMFGIAIAFKNWRQRSSNKILLNFSVAIAMQMLLLYVANNVTQNGIWCIVAGAALHYTVLSEFLWMLIIAFLQYRKFVTVLHPPTPNIVGKACTICWCFPLIPIVLLLSISENSYTKNIHGLCYPMGKSFYFAIALPISLIVLINFIIFIKIIFTICRRNVESYGSKESDARLQILLAVFLFFLLGISWVFGIALSLGGGVVFSYLFCLTATFQGLIMFLFFVVMNENSKTLWMHVRRILHLQPQHRRPSNSSCYQSQVTDGTESHSK